jgi:hypothetical protein
MWRFSLTGPGVTWFGTHAASTDAVLQTLVEDTAEALLPPLKLATPVAHGRRFDGTPITGGALRESLQWAIGDKGALLLGRGYGLYVLGGTAPHVIRPRQARALAFWSEREGRGVFRAVVQHPGTAPNDFRQRGLAQAWDENLVQQTAEAVLAAWLAEGAI